jgi:hypothetical protein
MSEIYKPDSQETKLINGINIRLIQDDEIYQLLNSRTRENQKEVYDKILPRLGLESLYQLETVVLLEPNINIAHTNYPGDDEWIALTSFCLTLFLSYDGRSISTFSTDNIPGYASKEEIIKIIIGRVASDKKYRWTSENKDRDAIVVFPSFNHPDIASKKADLEGLQRDIRQRNKKTNQFILELLEMMQIDENPELPSKTQEIIELDHF